jgi:hydrogenase/urease accessory protein HupE
MKNQIIYTLGILGIISLVIPIDAMAHDVVKDLENMSNTESASLYLITGYKHILPMGLDHILFIVSLVLLSNNLKQLIWLSSIFTLGHCLTLGLAMYGIFGISSSIVEPLIALSIIYVAVENLISKRIKTSRYTLVFVFGLLHGMGFAGALSEIGLPQNSYLLSLLMFNVGVELGQITIILITFFIIKKIKESQSLNWQKMMVPISSVIILIGTYWFVERLF